MRTEIMIAVADLERSSAWYQRLFGCRSDHGGAAFDRLVSSHGRVVQNEFKVRHPDGDLLTFCTARSSR